MKRPELLAIYLNDHLAGSIGGVETVRRARGSNEGTEFGAPLAALCAEIESDRETLEAVMKELDVARSRIKPAIGWLGEKKKGETEDTAQTQQGRHKKETPIKR